MSGDDRAHAWNGELPIISASSRRANLHGRAHPACIEIRVHSIGQIFHTLDPLPFRERDLDAGVEQFIVRWAGEMAGRRPVSIVIQLPPVELLRPDAKLIEEAIRSFFAYRAEVFGWELRELFRTGRAALAIGTVVLAVCILVGQVTEGLLGPGYLGRFFAEGLIILGWVANWRALEIFLYDWWPVVRRRRLYRRLAWSSVSVVAIPPEDAQG